MSKFLLRYGLKDKPPQISVEDFSLFSDAYEQAQLRAVKMFEETEGTPDLKTPLYNKYKNDLFTAYAYYLVEVLPYIDFSVEEVKENESKIYLVSNQTSFFDTNKFIPISISNAIQLLEKEEVLGLDTETEGLDCFTKKLLLIQIGNKEFQVVIDIASYGYKIPKELRDFLNSYSGTFILQNAKFDLKFLFAQDVIITRVYDTMLVETIITNGLQKAGRDLKTIAEKYCSVTLDKSVRGKIITKGLTNEVLEYGANDVKYLPEIRQKQLEVVNKYKLKGAVNLDNSFVVVLAYTEYCGIKLDYEKWKAKVAKNIDSVYKLKEELENQLRKDGKKKYFSGSLDLFTQKEDCILNWDSPKQVLELFEEYGIDVTVRERGESKKTINAKKLEPQIDSFPIIKPYIEYKEVQKEVSTYGYKWKNYINPVTGRIHTTYRQLMDTGRLSSGSKTEDAPNLQNIPRDEESRACFICEPGNVLIDADYSSQEQLILANFSKEENLLNFYARGFKDMHSYIAFLMYENIRRCPIEELTPEKLEYVKKEYPEQRRIAKSAGFAIDPFN